MKKILVLVALFYFKWLAKLQLAKIRPIIIGVGGASGKTSLCNFLSVILRKNFKVLETKGKNSETGIPLSILRIEISDYSFFDWLKAAVIAPFKVLFDWEEYDILVAEMGIDSASEPKNMSYLLKILKPKIAVLTNIAFEHSENFDVLAKGNKRLGKILNLTANEELLLLKSASENGSAVLNLDDSMIKREENKIKAKKITVSLKNSNADFFGESIKVNKNQFTLGFIYQGKKYSLKIKKPLILGFAYSFLIALAVSSSLNVNLKDAIKELENNFSLPPGRLTVFKGKKETTIIDSSYNSSLTPLTESLDLLKKISGEKGKLAILGDMRELGSLSRNQHEEVAKKILKTCDRAILIGPLMKKFAGPVLKRQNFPFYSFTNFTQAKEEITKIVKSGDFILVKGSQNTLYLERVVQMLLNDARDAKKLARRGVFWDKKRKEAF